MSTPRPVIIESPYFSPDPQLLARNLRYTRACLRHSLFLGEAPLASHLLYTQEGVLDDTIPAERARGMAAGWTWMVFAREIIVYEDLGLSQGMLLGIAEARGLNKTLVHRKLPPEFWPKDLAGFDPEATRALR